MTAFVTLDGLSCRTPDGKLLFSDLTLAFGAERIGLVGRNGAGKTTLLRAITGELTPGGGSVSRHGRIGLLRQTPEPGASVAGLMGVEAALARLARLEAGEGSEADLAEADWLLPARLETALAELGLAGLDPARPAATLSGGEATRAALAGLVAAEPDLLILDEPTNNLDAAAREQVARLLDGWRGGAVVVSHDRALLRRMDRIVELSSLGARTYGGGYDLYAERKAEEAAAAARQFEAAQRGLAQAEREAQADRERQARRDSAGRRFASSGSAPKILLGGMKRRAEATAGRLDRLGERRRAEAGQALEAAEARVERLRLLDFELPSTGLPEGRQVLAFEGVAFARPGEAPVFEDVSFRIDGPQRLALTGPNGSGKTTLIRLALGEIEPIAGTVRRHAPAALLDQHAAVLRPEETLVNAFRRLNPQAGVNEAHAALARFLFRNVDALKTAGALSGGERLRAALCCAVMAAEPPQLLVLDEPTNHLDLDSIAAVEAALRGYDGALLVVSHDRDFLDAVGVDRELSLG